MAAAGQEVKPGLRANRSQFALLVGVNALVGGMVGLERTLLPVLAEERYHLAAHSAILSFLIAFGFAKAIANYVAGRASDRSGRKNVLVAGWLLTFPVPFLLMFAPSWNWILGTNVLLGLGQGLTWSAAVIMKVDLAGPKRRGLAMGLNEFAGYLAVAISALLTAWIADVHGLGPEPFLLGVGFAVTGLLLSIFVVRETSQHAEQEQRGISPVVMTAKEIFIRTSWGDRSLRAVTQAGLVNNLNDGVAWGLFPLLFMQSGSTLSEVGLLGAAYPATWAFAQLLTGPLSDRYGRKLLITAGMIVQGLALIGFAMVTNLASEARFTAWMACAVTLGIGTAMVYPTLLAAIGDYTSPNWRASAVGIYRLWRDLGYVAGAIAGGLLADRFGLPVTVAVVGAITAASGIWAGVDLRPRNDASSHRLTSSLSRNAKVAV